MFLWNNKNRTEQNTKWNTKCISEKPHQQQKPNNSFCNYKWQELKKKKADFKVNIDQVKVKEIHQHLQNAINQQSVDSELVNCIASEISFSKFSL